MVVVVGLMEPACQYSRQPDPAQRWPPLEDAKIFAGGSQGHFATAFDSGSESMTPAARVAAP